MDEAEDILDIEIDTQEHTEVLAKLEQLEVYQNLISNEGVDRSTMEWLYNHYPQAVSKDYPIQSFTKERSEQNLEVALEDLSISKKLAMLALGALLGSLVVALISAFRKDQNTALIERIKSINERSEKLKKENKNREKDYTRDSGVDEMKMVDDFIKNHVREVSKNGGTIETTKLIEYFSPGGEVYKYLQRTIKTIGNRYLKYSAHIREYKEIVEKIYTAVPGDQLRYANQAQRIDKDIDDDFINTMDTLMEKITDLYRGRYDGYKPFFVMEVMPSHKYFTLFKDTLFKGDRIVGDLVANNMSQIKKSMDNLDKYGEYLTKGPMHDVKVKSNKINSDVLSSIRDLDHRLRLETQALFRYRTLHRWVLMFYDHLFQFDYKYQVSKKKQIDDFYTNHPNYRTR